MAIYKAVNTKGNGTHGAMKNCLEYALRPSKTDNETLCCVLGPCPDGPLDFNAVYGSFIDIKNEWGKDSGRMYVHTVLSFPKNESITPTEALEFGIRFAEKTYAGYQTAVAVHTDKEHIHCHFVVNTVSYLDGHKLQKSRKDLKADKEYCNELCREYGLSVAQKGKHADGSDMDEGDIVAWTKDKYRALIRDDKPSYLVDCAIAIAQVMRKARTKEQFIAEMSKQGYTVQWSDNRKHITFVDKDGKKVRDSNLQKTFNLPISKEMLKNEFIRQNKKNRRTDTRACEREYDIDGQCFLPQERKQRTQRRGQSASR